MVANRSADLVINDGSSTYTFPVVVEKGARKIFFKQQVYQEGDPTYPFRIPLFPLDGGIGRDRLTPGAQTYAKANADATYPNVLLHPPKLNTVTLTNGDVPFKFKAFDSVIFVLGGRYMYYIDPTTNTSTEDKDFGVGKAAVDMEVLNDQLVVAMGESEKIWTRTSAGVWAQATDNTFAIALGLVDSKLWRGEEVNQLSNALSAPLTLASWVPTDGNEYAVGDTTWSINLIVDFQGSVWVGKGDGMYAADPQYIFHNQTPQIKANPHVDNCKGTWIAHSSMFVPFVNGVLRIRLGSSLPFGPEITWRRDYRYWTRGGIEYNGNIYTLETDEGSSSGAQTAIYKWIPVDAERTAYVYHEWCRLGNTTKGYAITVSSIGTNPELFVTHGDDAKYIVLGRGGGADIDDGNYAFGTSMELESGRIKATENMSVLTHLVGVEAVCDYSGANESLTLSYRMDNQAYANLLNTQEGGGSAAISGTTNYESVRRFAPTTAEGQFFEIKAESTLVTTTSSPEILNLVAFGFLRPLMTDLITVNIDADENVWSTLGLGNGLDAYSALRLFRTWNASGTRLLLTLNHYDDTKNTRVMVVDVQFGEVENRTGENSTPQTAANLVVTFVRIPYGVSEYAVA